MKIGIDFRMGGNFNSGIGRYVLELLRHELPQSPQDEFIIFFHPANSDLHDLEALKKFSNAKLVAAPVRHYSWAEQVKLAKIFAAQNLDIMHFPNFNLPLNYRGPFAVTIHDLVHHKLKGHKKTWPWAFWAYKFVISRAASKAKAVIAVSQASKDDIVKFLRVPKEKITVIYEGSSLEPQSQEILQAVKNKYFIKRPYFLFVGTLERKKNIPALARSFDQFLKSSGLDIDLVIAGKADPHYPHIRSQALSITHAKNLVFTDFVSDAELAALYQGAYAFVSASSLEGFGLPGIEAMGFGLPLLVANCEVFNEIYDNAALYFNPEDSGDLVNQLKLITQDKQFYQQMRQKSLNRSVYFDWQKAAKETLQVIKKSAG